MVSHANLCIINTIHNFSSWADPEILAKRGRPMEAVGVWGRSPSCRTHGVWGQSPQKLTTFEDWGFFEVWGQTLSAK